MTNDSSNKKKIPRTVWVLGFASLLTDVSSEMIHSVLPLFLATSLGASATIIGLIDGVGEAVAAFLKLFSGALSDRIRKRKPLILTGYGLSAAVKPLFALAGNPIAVLAARCLDRVGKGIRGAPRDALIADVTDADSRGAAYGLRQSLDSVGAVVGPLIALAAMTATANDFRFVFWIALVPAIATVILLATGVSEPPSNLEPTSKKVNPLRMEAIKSLGPGFWFVFFVCLLFTLGNSSDAFILLKAKAIGVAPNMVPLCLVVLNVTYTLSAYPAGIVSDRLGRRGMLMCSFALYAIVYLCLGFTTEQWQLWSLLAIYGFYLGLSQGTFLALVADRVPQELRGTAFGLFSLSIGVGLLPASLIAGFLWDNISPQATFLAGAGFALVSLLIFAFDPHAYSKQNAEG